MRERELKRYREMTKAKLWALVDRFNRDMLMISLLCEDEGTRSVAQHEEKQLKRVTDMMLEDIKRQRAAGLKPNICEGEYHDN